MKKNSCGCRGDTEQESEEEFEKKLENAAKSYEEDKLAGGRGGSGVSRVDVFASSGFSCCGPGALQWANRKEDRKSCGCGD